ncbi:MAG: type II secretion system protein [Candidatus Gottesmanbacteria bacterium]
MKKGFSLIELIVVIAITAVLLAIALPNLLSARERARDAKKKQEMNEMKTALRLYYNDFQQYPSAGNCGGNFNGISGCGSTHVECCPATGCSVDFAVGDNCSVVYMKKFPSNFLGSSISIGYATPNTDSFCLATILENAGDPDIATSKARCVTQCTGRCTESNAYCVCAD